MQRNPGWKAFDKDRFYIGTTVPNLQKIYVIKKSGKLEQVYRYRSNMYRYMLCKKGQWLRCTGTPLTCTGTCGHV